MGAPAHTPSDPTFYRSPAEAVAAPAEKLAYVVAFDRTAQRPDALTVVDVDPSSARYGQVVGWADLPTLGDELHHFGWNACSSALAHEGHDMDGLQRRYLLLPGLRSSNVHVYDTQSDPTNPTLVKTIDAKELADKAGYSRPHTLHCGPEGIFLSCLGGADGADGPGGIALLDHATFDVLGAWENDRGPQHLAYDAWWHLNQNTLITSEWGSWAADKVITIPALMSGSSRTESISAACGCTRCGCKVVTPLRSLLPPLSPHFAGGGHPVPSSGRRHRVGPAPSHYPGGR